MDTKMSYERLCKEKENAETNRYADGVFLGLAQRFRSLKNYEDAAILASHCERLASEYKKIKKEIVFTKLPDGEICAETIADYSAFDELVGQLRERLTPEQKRIREEQNKEKRYKKLLEKLNNADAQAVRDFPIYFDLSNQLRQLGNYKDTLSLADYCERLIVTEFQEEATKYNAEKEKNAKAKADKAERKSRNKALQIEYAKKIEREEAARQNNEFESVYERLTGTKYQPYANAMPQIDLNGVFDNMVERIKKQWY